MNAFDISSNELYEKVTREYAAGVYNADLVHIKDEDGAIYQEMVLPGKFNLYYPSDIVARIAAGSRQYAMPRMLNLPNGSIIPNCTALLRFQAGGTLPSRNGRAGLCCKIP